MRLDRLEISGFKSFPDRADVAFDVGVTAIVGPNGCGKSNLVDAITWVLGEQSARSLRGERMEDVIFSGSDARKATGAAEVRLRLSGVPTESARRAVARREGLDGQSGPPDPDALTQPLQIDLPAVETRQVEIARRLYRSGESEYLIDGEGCRLRDVQDLLMDAGLGIKAYAVIEQGKIGQILSAKPTERRQLIEEAAGVTKYKSRRRAAELKLDAAQQNLTRVDDIVFEIEKQRATLKRQAARARRYKRLREELRRWEKILFARRYRALAQQIEVARARLTDAREREAAAVAAVTHVEENLASSQSELARIDERLRDVRDRMHARRLDNNRREQQLVFNRQQVEALASAALEVASDIAALEARREPARLELEARREAAARAEEARADAEASLADADAAARRAQQSLEGLERDVDDTRARLFASQNTVVTLQYAIERAQDGRQRLADAMERLEIEARDARIEAERHRLEYGGVESRLQAAHVAIGSLRESRAGREASLAASRAEQQQRMEELRAGERNLAALAARLRSLEELDAHREGYGDAARLILSGSASMLQHHGLVADYLETDSEHERVIEALLGDLLQCVIVPGHEDAEHGLAHVRAENAGRIGFLLADAGSRQAPVPTAFDGVVPVASLARVTGPYREAILDALRDLWVAPDSRTALECSKRTAGSVATSAGHVYRAGRLVYGGARAEARGILGIKREIKQLRQRLADDQHAVEELAAHLPRLETLVADTDAALAALSLDLHSHEKATVGLELQLDRSSSERDRLSRKLEQVAVERRQSEEEQRALETREQEAREGIEKLDVERREYQERLTEAQRRLADAREAAGKALQHAADAGARHATFVERATALANELLRLEEAAQDLEARILQRLDERRRGDERRAQLEASIAGGERRAEEDMSALAALGEQVQAAEQTSRESQQQVEASEASARESRRLLEEVRSDVSQHDLTRATIETDLAHLSAACVDTLQATLDQVAAEVEAFDQEPSVLAETLPDDRDEELEAEDALDAETGVAAATPPADDAVSSAPDLSARAVSAEEAIAGLRAKIDRLGPVNMMAIEQFDELEQRHTFLSAQRQDLVESIAATGEAIKRIDKTTRERFREAFMAVNRYFEETFTTLFGGGRAGLVLLDDDDLLESGIDIIAQPPGKRLQNVQLLSGGEKALTAMALMFGIFRYRPSPFCLLDEIDAPLDDANIARFIEMLRGMQENTQFILVTHHRRTMEIADRLYGVTMEEPGVSKLISLRLN